ncbi:MAG: hypothetical protein HN522_01765 [Flavobacteriales bacterium]|jgi:hypothetical protein|nr:hypothetical protein [Flavobacteriales bacterium]
MRKLIILIISILTFAFAIAQDGISYQGAATDENSLNQVENDIDGKIIFTIQEYINLSETVKATSYIKFNDFRNSDLDTKSLSQNSFYNSSLFTKNNLADDFVSNIASLQTLEKEVDYINLKEVKNVHTNNQHISNISNYKDLNCTTTPKLNESVNFILITNIVLLLIVLKL